MRALILAILISLFATGETVAMEALWGRVVSIDRQERLMVVRARPMAGHGSGDVPPRKELTVKFDAAGLPNCVAEGTVVRLWGSYSRKNPDVLNARFIRGAGRRSWEYDPTGVRQRLGMGRRAGRKGQGAPPTPRDGENTCPRSGAQ